MAKKKERESTKQYRKRAIALSIEKARPSMIQKEVDLAFKECLDLWIEYSRHPIRFGLPGSQKLESLIIPEEHCHNLPQGFIEQWQPKENRYLRAREMLEAGQSDPDCLVSWPILRHVSDNYSDLIVHEHHQQITYDPLNGREKERQRLYVEPAKSIAERFWRDNPNLKLRPMAEKVLKHMKEKNLGGGFLPGTPMAVSEVIRDVAPESALKKGRPRKNK